jgi:RNA polymerase sigma factor (sigma-70 family)
MLVAKYRQYLFQVVYSVLHDYKDAEDVTQEVFIQVYRSLPHYRYQGLKSWLTRIAINKSIDWKRQRERRQEDLQETLEQTLFSESGEVLVELPVWQKQQRELVHERLQQLPDNYREVVYAYFFEEKSYKQIAHEQGITIKTVESKLYRAKNWMRTHWREGDW